MVPIHDTDLADQRWSKDEWRNYELWERIEHRVRRKKWLWIFATFVVFMALSAVPTVIDRWPRWNSLYVARRIGQEINAVKRAASTQHRAFRIRFETGGSLDYVIESAESCAGAMSFVRQGTLGGEGRLSTLRLLSPEDGSRLGIPGLLTSFCYDDLAGSDAVINGESLVGFGVIDVNDLTASRIDRAAVLLISGPSGEMSFD